MTESMYNRNLEINFPHWPDRLVEVIDSARARDPDINQIFSDPVANDVAEN